MQRLRTLTSVLVLFLATAPVPADVPESPPTHITAIRTMAEKGDAAAQSNLGVMYDNGEGVPEDDKEAVKWYRLAAEQGYAPAQSNLGVMYDNGEGVPEDDKEAVKWYRLAAEQGYARAQYNLGVMYANGEGVPEDDVQAYAWMNLAKAAGDKFADEAIPKLKARMTAEQIAEGQKLSREILERIHAGVTVDQNQE